jgi:hypothetical protein
VLGHRRRIVRRDRPWVRSLVAGAAVLAVVGVVGIAGARGGYPATRPRLMSGTAWLASSLVGQLTLLDGSSAEVAAQVQVAARGNGLDAVQQGSTAYVVNRTVGSLRRVDGATFDVSEPVSPVPGATDGLRAFAGPHALYALDAGSGVLAEADPQTLAARGRPVSMAARVAGQAASIDDGGRLWLLDGETGNLDWIERGQRHTRNKVAGPGTGLLTLADGKPVVVDQRGRTAVMLEPGSAAVRHRTTLDLRADDRIQVSGSPHAPRVYVVASRGVLAVCELTAPACSAAVALGSGGAELGAAVENGGRVFVPDYTGGRVWIVDLRDLRVIAQPQVVPARTRFQLLARDNVVFFNDPESEHAGVLQLDGGVRQVAKYDPRNPGAGLTKGSGGGDRPPAPAPPPENPTTPPDQPKPPDPKQRPPQSAPKGPQPTPPPPPGDPQPVPSASSSAPPTEPPPPPPPLPDLQISASASPSQVGENVTLTVGTASAPAPVSAQWVFGDGATDSGLSPSHTWNSARTFQVTVTATFPDGRTKTRSVAQNVVAPPPVKGTLTVTVTGPGKVTSSPGGINCPGTCSAQFNENTRVTLTATTGERFDGFTGDCAGTGQCRLTLTAAGATVDAHFTDIVNNRTLTLNVKDAATTGGGGIVDVFPGDGAGSDRQCDQPRCVTSWPETETLLLTPNGEGVGVSRFDHWTGACSGSGDCHLTMTVNRTVTAVWVRCPVTGCAVTGSAVTGGAAANGPPARRQAAGRPTATGQATGHEVAADRTRPWGRRRRRW